MTEVQQGAANVELVHRALGATICDGRIFSVEFYARRDEALEAAGEDA